jgi:predicted RNA-binding Zn ribbon-like protein
MSQVFELTVDLDGLPPAKGPQAPLSEGHPHLQRTRALLQAVRALLPSDFRPLSTSVGLELTIRTPTTRQAWDATNYLGGIADVLQNKYRRDLPHLGELATVSVYENDRVIREVRYQHQRSDTVGYRLRIWSIDRSELEAAIGADQEDLSVEPRPARSPELCIGFVNTLVGSPLTGSERLRSYADLLRWGEEEGVLASDAVNALRSTAALHATEAENVLVGSRRFREAIRKILVHERNVYELDQVNATLQRYLPLRSLRWIDGKAQWVWPDRIDLERILWPVAQSILVLMTSGRRKRVRPCVGCKQLFLDTSRNNRRRWCDMKSCGNRAKARAFQLRRRNRTTNAEATASLPLV